MVGAKVNSKILEIWKGFKENRGEDMPMLYPAFKGGGILFVGCNPSKRKKAIIFAYDESNLEDLAKKVIENEEAYRGSGKDSYEAPFSNLSMKFSHADLFCYRMTTQGDFKTRILINPKEKRFRKESLNEFGKQQVELIREIIEEAKPAAIIVVNAFASDIIKEVFKEEVGEINRESGAYYWNKKIPLFFSGMLTAQRALDKHSRERLFWHVKKVLLGSL